VTRLVLARERNQRQADLDYLSGIPAGKEDDEVQTVVAYGSQADFVRDYGTLAIPGSSTGRPPKAAGASQVVFAFESRFLVPDDDRRTDDYLLGQAVELAHTDEIQEWRAALNRWRRRIVLAGIPEADAERQLTDVIADYERAAGRLRITTRVRFALAVVAAATGAAAVFVPPLGAVAATCGLATLLPTKPISKELQVAAMFHQAQRLFN
jgi:hypothetical protein